MKQNTVSPSTLRTEKRNREYKPSAQALINQERASKVYPHRLITPDGVGNGTEYGHGFGRGR